MTFALLLAGAVLGGLIVLFVQGRRNERATARDWTPLVVPRHQRALRRAESQLNDGLTLADTAYDRAQTLFELGSVAEARELLRLGYEMIDRFAPDLFRMLAMMTVYSRMVAAIVPVQPLRAARFQTTGVSVLVRLGALGHHLLTSTAERFRFRLFVIGQSARLLLRGLGRTTLRLLGAGGTANDLPAAEWDWDQVRAMRSDFHVLTDETVESLRVLLTSLDASRTLR
jgi:hypothetical protein